MHTSPSSIIDNNITERLELVQECMLCGASDFTPLFQSEDHYSGENFPLTVCKHCGFTCTSPRPAPHILGSYYPPEYYGKEGKRFHGTLERIVHWFRTRIADKIEKRFPTAGSVLEVGSGRGTLLAELAKRGWNAYGTEFSPTLAETSTNKHGVTVHHTPDLRDCSFPEGKFNVIICYHVLEHLPNPVVTLQEMRRILSNNGLLLVAVPNFGGMVARFTKGMWFAVDAPRHLGHFTPGTLDFALNNAGFTIEHKKTLSLEQDVFGFAQSMMNMLRLPYNIFYDLIRSSSAKMRHNNKRNSLLRSLGVFALGGVLSMLALPLVLILEVLKSGGTIEVWAKPVITSTDCKKGSIA